MTRRPSLAPDPIDTDVLEVIGEATRAHSTLQNYAFGELSIGRHQGTSRRARLAEQREFKCYYLRKWHREAKADPAKWARVYESRLKAKARYREKIRADPRLGARVRAAMTRWRATNRDAVVEQGRSWRARNADKINCRRRERAAAQRVAGTPRKKRKSLTPEQRAAHNARNRAYVARKKDEIRERRKALYRANLDTNRQRKREDARRRYRASKEEGGADQ